ncbi:MAG: hypothetical protein HY912_14155 [Desulfomonile tiedjei]|uniref:Uncharacterized protein n=1 Tax=Desulfomonile tiedjei TaxID=2358 RepID=A0A9D6V4F4_9BACT|nr:hypothetical protein [Desulfomonile tiedjei]
MCGLRLIVLISILSVAGTTSSWAVGYERLEIPQNQKQTKTVVTEAKANGSFMQKCPALLDETAGVVRDILSQFGLINKKTP